MSQTKTKTLNPLTTEMQVEVFLPHFKKDKILLPNRHFANKETGSEKKQIIKILYHWVENYTESQISLSVVFCGSAVME